MVEIDCWNKIEKAPIKELKELQGKRLRYIVRYVYDNSRFYRKRFDDMGLKPSDIRSIDDIRKLPFTEKSDLRDNYPFGMFAKPLDDVVEIHASSGTTGKPTVVGYTKKDIDLWSEAMARSLTCAGVHAKDVLQNAYGYGLFTGGLGAHYGALTVGASVIPISGGNTPRQLMLMQDFGTTVLTCTPSYALHIAEEAPKLGFDLSKMKVRVGIHGAEPWTHEFRQKIEEAWGNNYQALDIYGLSEIIGPGVAMECPGKDGLHVWSDVFYPEIVDPKTGEPVSEGEEGELVFTTLTKEAMPLIRYRTHDITHLITEKCPHCGRIMPRFAKFTGRSDDMLIIRGVNVFPSQIEHVLMKFPAVGNNYMIVVDRAESLDTLAVRVEMNPALLSDKMKDVITLEKQIEYAIKETCLVSAKVQLVEPGSIPRAEGKAKRVEDKRKGKI